MVGTYKPMALDCNNISCRSLDELFPYPDEVKDMIDYNNKISYQKKLNFFSGIIFQLMFIYCSNIFYNRISNGIYNLWLERVIIFKLLFIFFKCFIYFILLMSSFGLIITAADNKDTEIYLIKLSFIISFLDYFDTRYIEPNF